MFFLDMIIFVNQGPTVAYFYFPPLFSVSPQYIVCTLLSIIHLIMDTYGRFSIPKFAIFYMPRNHKFGIQWYSTLLSLIGRIELECELLLQTNRNWTKYSNSRIAKVFFYCRVFVCEHTISYSAWYSYYLTKETHLLIICITMASHG